MDPKVNYLLRLGDNALILSQQLCRLCGKGPALEEDMALSNVALDLLGQTRLWYEYAAELENAGRDEDRLAYHRDAHDFKNCLLLEQPNGNYADTMMRQFYFDCWHYFVVTGLVHSSDARIAAIAEKSLKEVTYHLRRSGDLIVRMGDGTTVSHAKTQAGIVLTGGTSKMEGAVELAEEIFHMPVRLGVPHSFKGLTDVVRNPIYSTAVGLLLYGLQKQSDGISISGISNRDNYSSDEQKAPVFERLKRWVQGNF